MTIELKKRTWAYIQQPNDFGYPSCSCGNHLTRWSEYKEHLWCSECEKDFIPEYQGILDGPIPLGCATMMGVNFDKYEIPSMKVMRFDVETGKYDYDKE